MALAAASLRLSPDRSLDSQAELVVQQLLEAGTEAAEAAANACVRAGARYNHLGVPLPALAKARFNELAKEHAAAKRRAAELEKSLAQAGGAAALSSGAGCVLSGSVTVKLAKWSSKFFVLTKDEATGELHLHRFATDVATQVTPRTRSIAVPSAASMH